MSETEDFSPDANAGETSSAADTSANGDASCPEEYTYPFFVYDFMPQKIMMKVPTHGHMTAIDVLQIRGWGFLTGGGALNIPPDVAAKIQDNFGQWVAETLSAAVLKSATLPHPSRKDK